MKQTLLYISAILTLLGCGNNAGQFRIRGNFDHLEQGEFYIYSPDGGMDRLDTLRLVDGAFDYTASLTGEATYHILYPNFSELVIFGQEGKQVKVKGDARSLSDVEVKGTKDNELYTKFRKEARQLPQQEETQLARRYMLEHPTSAVSRLLFCKYYLLSPSADAKETKEVYDSLCRACPGEILLSNLAQDVRSKGIIQKDATLPDFKLKTREVRLNPDDSIHVIKSRVLTRNGCKDSTLLFVFWASWRNGSLSALYQARKLRKESQRKVLPISYSLDVDENQLKNIESKDSIDYPSYCDFKCWNSTLVRQWGIKDLPYYILVDGNGHIIAEGTDWSADIEPKAKDLREKKKE